MNKLQYISKRKIVIVLFLIFAISINFALFLSLLNQSNSSNKVQEKTIEFDNLKFNGPEINITTPENITYTAPMSGYYPATYGFESDENNDDPDGWTDSSGTNCDAKIVEEKYGHKKVLELSDNSGSYWAVINQTFNSAKMSGTVELWALNTHSSNVVYIYLRDSSDNICIDVRLDTGRIYMRYNGGWIDCGAYTVNTWYHISVEFDCVSNTYDGYLDGTLKADGASFFQNDDGGGFTHLFLSTNTPQSGYLGYYDAIGYSWDPNYNKGDNFYEGLLLRYDTSFIPDWIGYSLDGQANRIILGNTTIPMLSDGLHNLQVFGNNSFGTMYQSDIRYFSIDTHAPTSMIFFTPYSGMNQVIKSTKFNLTANDGLGSGVSVIRYKINNSGWIDYNSPFDLSSYDYGYYMIYYYSVDVVGHIESENTLLVELIEEPSEPIISGYITMLLITSICIAAIITIKKRLKNSF